MESGQWLERMARYHLWAQDRVLTGLEEMANDAPEEAIKLFGHILMADMIWYERLEGRKFNRDLLDREVTLASCRAELTEMSEKWMGKVGGISEEELDRTFRYMNPKGERSTFSVRDSLTHVFNHGTYHRAQIARIVRQSGGTPVPTDFSVFVREG